jgi:hypothetical protein
MLCAGSLPKKKLNKGTARQCWGDPVDGKKLTQVVSRLRRSIWSSHPPGSQVLFHSRAGCSEETRASPGLAAWAPVITRSDLFFIVPRSNRGSNRHGCCRCDGQIDSRSPGQSWNRCSVPWARSPHHQFWKPHHRFWADPFLGGNAFRARSLLARISASCAALSSSSLVGPAAFRLSPGCLSLA